MILRLPFGWFLVDAREIELMVEGAILAHDLMIDDLREHSLRQTRVELEDVRRQNAALERQVELLTQPACLAAVNEADRARRLP